MSALSLSLKDKERLRDWEIESLTKKHVSIKVLGQTFVYFHLCPIKANVNEFNLTCFWTREAGNEYETSEEINQTSTFISKYIQRFCCPIFICSVVQLKMPRQTVSSQA